MISAGEDPRQQKIPESFSAIARSVMISAALGTRTCIGVSRFSAIARSVMISAHNTLLKSDQPGRFSAIARSVMISATSKSISGHWMETVSVL